MSFSTDIKNDITKLDINKQEAISELSGIIRNIGEISNDIVITTENASLARTTFTLIKDLYDVTSLVTVRKNYYFNKSTVYILVINNKVDQILKDLSIREEGLILDKPRDYIICDEEQKMSYLRGCFLACGSVNDPKKSRYHLEFYIDSEKYGEFLKQLLNEFDLNSKLLKRDKGYMVYIKESEKIGDFLRIIKAYNAVMYYEDIRIYRDHKNMTNRLNNCEQANVEKTMNTALNQINDIRTIEKFGSLDLLDDKTKEICEYRVKYPESSLLELSEIVTLETGNKISKSGLNHRFRKIRELAIKLKQ